MAEQNNSNSSKTIPKIRTFADDFARSQGLPVKPHTEPIAPADEVTVSVNRAPTDIPTQISIPPNKTTDISNSESDLVKITSPELPKKESVGEKSIPTPVYTKQTIPTPPKPKPQPVITIKPFSVQHKTTTPQVKKIENIIEDDGVELDNGSIVRETKKTKFKLIPAIITAIGGWFGNKKAKQKDKKKLREESIPKVPLTNTRTETIASAAAFGVLPESDDHKEVSSNIDTTKSTYNPSIQIADEPENIPRWSTAEDVLEEETESISTEKQNHDQALAELEEAVTDEKEEVIEDIQLPQEIAEVENEPIDVYQNIPEPIEVEQPVNIAPETITEEIPEPADEPTLIEENESNIVNYQFRATEQAGVRVLPILPILISVIAIAAGVGLTILIFNFVTNRAENILPTKVETAVKADESVSITLGFDKNKYLNALSEQTAKETAAVTIYYPVIATEKQTIEPASVEELLSVLKLNAPGSFTRNISELTFGSTKEGYRFIVIKVNNFDTAFSGMLQWESSMASDLNPWLLTNGALTFTDTTYKNLDLRVAERTNDADITYSFINRNTILIATDKIVLDIIPNRLNTK